MLRRDRGRGRDCQGAGRRFELELLRRMEDIGNVHF